MLFEYDQIPHFLFPQKETEADGSGAEAFLSRMLLDSDVWADADMASVIKYLRGNRKLNVPPKIREVLCMNK